MKSLILILDGSALKSNLDKNNGLIHSKNNKTIAAIIKIKIIEKNRFFIFYKILFNEKSMSKVPLLRKNLVWENSEFRAMPYLIYHLVDSRNYP